MDLILETTSFETRGKPTYLPSPYRAMRELRGLFLISRCNPRKIHIACTWFYGIFVDLKNKSTLNSRYEKKKITFILVSYSENPTTKNYTYPCPTRYETSYPYPDLERMQIWCWLDVSVSFCVPNLHGIASKAVFSHPTYTAGLFLRFQYFNIYP